MEFFNSFLKSVNERLTSPLYGALLIATVMWNYDIFLTVFFVDNEAILKITGDKLMKATYIHDVLFPTVFGRNLLECMHPLLAYVSSFTWRVLPVFGLTWIFLTQVPKIANKVHGIERTFMKTREEKNIDYEEGIAQYKLEHSKNQDALLQKQKKDTDIKANILKLQESNFNKSIELSQKQNQDIELVDSLMTATERNKYAKFIENEVARNSLIEAIQYIDPNNENEDTLIDELGLDDKISEKFRPIAHAKIVGDTLNMGYDGKWKHYLFLKDFGKKVVLQMVKDGYLKEEDLEGKI